MSKINHYCLYKKRKQIDGCCILIQVPLRDVLEGAYYSTESISNPISICADKMKRLLHDVFRKKLGILNEREALNSSALTISSFFQQLRQYFRFMVSSIRQTGVYSMEHGQSSCHLQKALKIRCSFSWCYALVTFCYRYWIKRRALARSTLFYGDQLSIMLTN